MKRRVPYQSYFNCYREYITLNDLAKSAGMSDFTVDFRKERNSIMGAESKNVKLIDVKTDQNKDIVTFYFLSETTPKYPDNYSYKETDPETALSLHNNRSKTYEMHVKVLDFFKWLDTTPDQIENKDIEDVFRVANVQLFCNCPSFQYQGMNYNLSMFDGSIYPETRPDNYWRQYHNSDNFVCKHLGGLINSYKFFIPQMRMKIKKALGLTRN